MVCERELHFQVRHKNLLVAIVIVLGPCKQRPQEVLLMGNATYVYEAVVEWNANSKQIIAL